jgi:integrase
MIFLRKSAPVHVRYGLPACPLGASKGGWNCTCNRETGRQSGECRGGTLDDHAFPSRIDHADHISTRQYARLVDEWVTGIALRGEDYGAHSLRRTKASIIYKQTGNLGAVQILLGHTKIESTVRYLGVDIEDALALAEGSEV